MSRLWAKWNAFFFTPQSPLPIALFRIGYGLCVVATLLLLRSDWLEWYGVHGWVTLSTMTTLEPGPRLNLFTVLPQNDASILAFFWVFLACAILLTLGLCTRLSTIAVFISLASIHQRNLLINHGGDTFLRVAGFFLIFAPAGAALSLDCWLARWIPDWIAHRIPRWFAHSLRPHPGLSAQPPAPRAPWAQRMIQFELAILYFTSFWWKAKGATWWNGTALFYVLHLHEVRRFPLPGWVDTPLALKLGSWLALALEFSLGVLIWIRPLRYPLLVAGLLFHLSLEYTLNVPMFQWDVLIAYVLFLDPEDLDRWFQRATAFLRRSISRRSSTPQPTPTPQ